MIWLFSAENDFVFHQCFRGHVFIHISLLWYQFVENVILIQLYLSYNDILYCSAPDTDCSPPAPAGRPHISDHPAQHQFHRGGWAGNSAGNPVPGQPVHVDRDSRCGVTHLQSLASGARHRIPHQCPTHPTWGGGHWSARTPSDQQDKVCRWVRSSSKIIHAMPPSNEAN